MRAANVSNRFRHRVRALAIHPLRMTTQRLRESTFPFVHRPRWEEEWDDVDGSSRRIRADDRYGTGEGRRARDLRDHGRSGEGDDFPVAVPARGARAAQLPDH